MTNDITLKGELLTLSQDPMPEPDSSTTIELQRTKPKAEPKAEPEHRLEPNPLLDPPSPPTTVMKAVRPNPYGVRTPPTPLAGIANPMPQFPASIKANPYAPVEYRFKGKGGRAIAVAVGVIGVAVILSTAFTPLPWRWLTVVAGAVIVGGAWLAYNLLDETERDRAAKAVETDYDVRMLQVAGGNGTADVMFTGNGNPDLIRLGVVSYSHGIAWLRSPDGRRVIRRD